MTHSHDVQKIHTHYLEPSSHRERCEFRAAFGDLASSDIEHGACASPVCRAESSQAQKVGRRIYYFFFTIKTFDYFFFLDNC